MPRRVPGSSGSLKAPDANKVDVQRLLVFRDALELYARGAYGQSSKVLIELCSQENVEPTAMILLTRALANQGHHAQALEWNDKAMAADKLNPVCYYLRAIILQEMGLFNEAIGVLQRALFLDPGFVLAEFTLGNLWRRVGKPTRANKHFQNTIELLKQYPEDETLPESEGISARRLASIVTALIASGA